MNITPTIHRLFFHPGSLRGLVFSPLCLPGVFGRLKDVIEPRAKEEKDEFREGRPAMDKRDEEKSGGGNAQERNRYPSLLGGRVRETRGQTPRKSGHFPD